MNNTEKSFKKSSLKSDGTEGSPNREKSVPAESGRRWLAAYVKMHHERKVRDRLTDMEIENFLPVQEVIRHWSDRRKKVERVLIPMMIFVRVNVAEQRQVIELPAVLRYFSLRGEYAPTRIPDSQMDNFRRMLDFSDEAVNMENHLPAPGQRVRVIKGSLQGLEGELITFEGKSRIAVRIEQLGYATVEINAGMVEGVE